MKRKFIALSIASITIMSGVNTIPVMAKSNKSVEATIKKSPEEIKKIEDLLKVRISRIEDRLDEIKLEPSLEKRGQEYDEVFNLKGPLFSHVSMAIRKYGVSEEIRDLFNKMNKRYHKEYDEYFLNLKFPNANKKDDKNKEADKINPVEKVEEKKVIDTSKEKIESIPVVDENKTVNPINMDEGKAVEKKEVQASEEKTLEKPKTNVIVNEEHSNIITEESKANINSEEIKPLATIEKKEIPTVKKENLEKPKINVLSNDDQSSVKKEENKGHFIPEEFTQIKDFIKVLENKLDEAKLEPNLEKRKNKFNDIFDKKSILSEFILQFNQLDCFEELKNLYKSFDKRLHNEFNDYYLTLIHPDLPKSNDDHRLNTIRTPEEIHEMENYFKTEIRSLEDKLNKAKLESDVEIRKEQYEEIDFIKNNLANNILIESDNLSKEIIESINTLSKRYEREFIDFNNSLSSIDEDLIRRLQKHNVDKTTIDENNKVNEIINVKHIEETSTMINAPYEETSSIINVPSIDIKVEDNFYNEPVTNNYKNSVDTAVTVKPSIYDATVIKEVEHNNNVANTIKEEVKISPVNDLIAVNIAEPSQHIKQSKIEKTPVVKSVEKVKHIKTKAIIENSTGLENKASKEYVKVNEIKNYDEKIVVKNIKAEDKSAKENKEIVKEFSNNNESKIVNENKDKELSAESINTEDKTVKENKEIVKEFSNNNESKAVNEDKNKEITAENVKTEDKAVEDKAVKENKENSNNTDKTNKNTEIKNNTSSPLSKTVKIVLGAGAVISSLGFFILKLLKKF
ncbi:hypothetical protein [Clostridium tarantellae]|uniref:Uncharacterized protein n=1 Tax=Clostridium tarantellae TaxID=39493 RepID=A0A6I1MVZ1_9CLOT|nr:hypothetical protein [Clostridium tarantellae]MPQ44991.1 hypothetical protein [Clostridium tarantellae]